MKYYEIMELECETPIFNQAVGMDLHLAEGDDWKTTVAEIDARGNNHTVREISERQFKLEQDRMIRRNYHLATGF